MFVGCRSCHSETATLLTPMFGATYCNITPCLLMFQSKLKGEQREAVVWDTATALIPLITTVSKPVYQAEQQAPSPPCRHAAPHQ